MAVIFDSSWNVEHNFGRRPKMTTPPKFGQNWLSGFKEEDFFYNCGWTDKRRMQDGQKSSLDLLYQVR